MNRSLLIDLDGVLYQGDKLIPGAETTVRWIQQQKIPHLFVTNTTSRSRKKIVEKLESFDISVSEESILTPPVAACKWLLKHAPGPTALFVPNATLDDFNSIAKLEKDKSTTMAVVVGDYGENWTFSELNRAFTLLINNPKSILVALGMTRYWRASEGLRLDAGPFVKALEYASNRRAVVLGKPSSDFYEAALQLLSSESSQAYMIGDDIIGDIGGAQRAGLNGILVRTGKFTNSDLDLGVRPYDILDSFAELPTWWNSGVLPKSQ